MRLAAQAKGGYYPTPDRVVDLVADLIDTPAGSYYRNTETLRILDPCCGGGDALVRLTERLDRPNALPIETYGVELHRDRSEEAEKRLHRTLASDLFATSIANGAFGLLLLNPPYDYDSEDKRTEHAFLTQTTRYLAESGLLVFIVPRQRLAVSARYLSTHYGRMRCWGFPDPERQVFDQVVLMGYRKADPVPDANAESMVLEWAVGEPEPLRSQRHSYSYAEYTPATMPSGDILFTTRTVDPVAAAVEGPPVGAVGQHGHHRHALARRGQPHPPADAPATGPHGDAGCCGFPRQPRSRRGRAAHLGQGSHQQGDGVGRGRSREGGPPRQAHDHRRGPRPGRRPDRGHRSVDDPQRPVAPTRPRLLPLQGRRGLASFQRNTPYK